MQTNSLVKVDGHIRNKSLAAQQLQNLDLQRPSDKERDKNMEETRRQLAAQIAKKANPGFLSQSTLHKKDEEDQYVRYTPTTALNKGSAKQRVIQISQAQEDPLEPPRHKHKKVPRAIDQNLPVINRSPPRKLTAQDMKDWKIPACISNWQNANGYTIPLHMRLQADGRGLQDVTVNARHAALADAMYTAERQARKETEMRNVVQSNIKLAQAQAKEERIKQAATLARAEKEGLMASSFSQIGKADPHSTDNKSEHSHQHHHHQEQQDRAEDEARRERDEIRRQLRMENERNRRREVGGKNRTKEERDRDRDISEKIALGQAQPTHSRDALYDQRLFNQTSGLQAGFAEEDDYNLYDKPLFADRTSASIYKNVNRDTGAGLANEVSDDGGDDPDGVKDVLKPQAREPARGFEGTEPQTSGKRSNRAKPVEFEKSTNQQDKVFTDDVMGMQESDQKRPRHN